jgi:hypothetical protein
VPLSPDIPFVARDPATTREAWRLRAAGLVRPVLTHPTEVLAGSHLRSSPQLRAAALAAAIGAPPGPPSAFAFRTAAWIHAGDPEPRLVELAIPRTGPRPTIPGVRARRLALPADHVASIAGVGVTTPARTAADLARDLSVHEALFWLERLRTHTGLTATAVLEALEADPRARHAASARRLVSRWPCP